MEREAELLNIPPEAQSAEDVHLPADAAERKRVLNILAQRRYRRRRREKQVALENFVSASIEKPTTTTQPSSHRVSEETTPQLSSGNSTSPESDNSDMLLDTTWSNPSDALMVPQTFDFNTLDFSNENTSWSSPDALVNMSSFLQNDDITNANFADDFNIAVPELDLLRAAYDIANRMQSASLLFDLNAQSIFHTTDCSSWMLTLPKNLQPTPTQLAIPHHPVLDILPWPTVRNRLINMYNLPADIWPRHPEDGTESSLIRFVYDMEDSGGIRVTGPDPSTEDSWEIEQRFFEAWWWAMDQKIVRSSNKKRLARGMPLLCAPKPAYSSPGRE